MSTTHSNGINVVKTLRPLADQDDDSTAGSPAPIPIKNISLDDQSATSLYGTFNLAGRYEFKMVAYTSDKEKLGEVSYEIQTRDIENGVGKTASVIAVACDAKSLQREFDASAAFFKSIDENISHHISVQNEVRGRKEQFDRTIQNHLVSMQPLAV